MGLPAREMVQELKMTGQLSLLSQLLEDKKEQESVARSLQAVLHNIEGRAKYRALHRVLKGQNALTAVTAVQALYRITGQAS